ncbi:hypothetical protein [Nocardia cyriacigeorgica]|uniref:hypothetical protein n=1 Tax=Nocardia cyriacigeorgica TaxID=135487 RepID=UPI0024569498|nr:hypothetical protein [Nocardia cyriacigeorgica]
MTDQHLPPRALGYARLFALVVLLGGIVAMHAGVFSIGQAGAHAHGAVSTSSGHGHARAEPSGLTRHEHRLQHGGTAELDHNGSVSPAAAADAPGTAARGAHQPRPATSDLTVEALSPADTAGTEPIPAVGTGMRVSATEIGTHVSATGIGTHEQDCGGGGCGAQGGMHACVFILSMLGLVIGLVLLFRLAFQPLYGSGTLTVRRPARRERPPPWTVPSLSELSILRV